MGFECIKGPSDPLSGGNMPTIIALVPWLLVPKLQEVPTVLSVRPVAGALLKALAPSVIVYGCAHWPGCVMVGCRVGWSVGLTVGPMGVSEMIGELMLKVRHRQCCMPTSTSQYPPPIGASLGVLVGGAGLTMHARSMAPAAGGFGLESPL